MIQLKQDSRDKQGHVFGQTTDIPLKYILDIQDSPIELPGEVDCTAISTCIMAESQTGIKYDINDLWSRVPNKTQFGVDPRDTLGEVIKNGLKPLGFETAKDKRWTGYVRADTGSMNPSRNIQSMILTTNSAVMINTNWYANWQQPANTVLPIGQTIVSGHSYAVISGWKIVNGLSVFIINAWQGYTLLMPFDVMDDAITKYGCTAFILTTKDIGDKIQLNLLEKIKDLCVNVVLFLQQLLVMKKKDMPMPSITPTSSNNADQTQNKITTWANLIAKFEGATPSLNNPGNFKYSTLMASWGGQKAGAGSDGGFFCKFPTRQMGFQALCNFLTLGCEDELISYHKPKPDHPDVNPRTIKGFTLVYTNFPKPAYDYSDNIIKELGVSPTTNISTFI